MFVDNLVQIMTQLMTGLFYLPSKLISIFLAVIFYIWSSLTGVVYAFYNLFGSMYTFTSTILTTAFPLILVGILLMGFGLVIIMRIYSMIKDVSIAGFKI